MDERDDNILIDERLKFEPLSSTPVVIVHKAKYDELKNALFMAKRVMKRNLERAEDALQSADKDDLLKGIIAECKAWLRDYEPLPDATNTPRPGNGERED